MSTTALPKMGHSVTEVAEALGVHPDTVRNMIERGTLRARQVGGKGSRVVVLADDVQRFLAGPDPESAPEARPHSTAASRIAASIADGSLSPADAAALLKVIGGAA